jgi:Na+/pantothenate symporter
MPLFPRAIVWLLGETETVKFAPTTRVTVAVLLASPLVPVIVSVYEAGGVEAIVEMLSVLEPEVVKLEGLNNPVAPEGSPVTLKLTVPLNPLP